MHFSNSALVVVDAQQGFTELCPDELPIPGALDIVGNINKLLEFPWGVIDASKDWHPPDHCSFKGQRDNIYPPHCVAGTKGAEFIPGLNTDRFHTIWRKGFNKDRDAYAITQQHLGYVEHLGVNVAAVVICGLATNICCLFLAKEVVEHGYAFDVYIVEDASAGIDIPEAKLFQEKAKKEGEEHGIGYVKMSDIIARWV